MVFPGKFSEIIQPEKLHVLSLSVLINELKDTRGGVAANIAYTLALLGEQPLLYGSVGHEAKDYMDDLAKIGVDTSHVHFSKLPTATFTVMTDQANCQVGGFYPGAMGDANSLSLQKHLDDQTFVVISPHDPLQMRKQVTECKKHHARVFYDIGQQANNVDGADICEGIDAAEVLIVNDYEMGVLVQKTGWSEKEIRAKVKVCVTTLGENGCVVFEQTGTKLYDVPAVEITKVIDPTGAGDAFRAGFLYGYVRNYSPVVCAQLGATAAAFAIEKRGTQEHTFTTKEFFQRYEKNYGKL